MELNRRPTMFFKRPLSAKSGRSVYSRFALEYKKEALCPFKIDTTVYDQIF